MISTGLRGPTLDCVFISGPVAVLVPATAAEPQVLECPGQSGLERESACDDPSAVSSFVERLPARVLGGGEGAAVRGHVHRHEPLAGRAELHRVQLLRRGGSRYSDTHSLGSV